MKQSVFLKFQRISTIWHVTLHTFRKILPRTRNLQLLFGLTIAQYHPVPVDSQGSLVLFKTIFGFCVGGTLSDGHCGRFPKVKLSVTKVNLTDFFGTENMGVSCTPNCGNCKCGNCPLGTAEFSIKDQK